MSIVDGCVGNVIAEGPTRAVPDLLGVIARQCRQHPDSCAVIASDRRLTYHDLAVRVAALARRLAGCGVTTDSLVGIYMPRGADELTAMLAVLTLGAAYVPLDPAQPASRLAMILADAHPDVVMTKQSHPLLTEERGFRTVIVDDGTEPSGAEDESWDPSDAPDARAYVLFTSGSTGRPKGVEIPRRALSNLLGSMIRRPELRESDVLLAVSTTMFDIAVLELFGPLCVGGTVHIVDSDVIRDGRRLRAVLEHESISVMQATPTMWHMLVDAGWTGSGRLRMWVGGEALSPDLARQLLRRGELWNMYGPTETTVWSTCKRIDSPDDITIGGPIDNTVVCVLDEHGSLLPAGVTGELCIGGAGLARGYLGRPDLTAERFIQNPLGPPGERIYRTGDLVRLLENGECAYLGRVDHQVKIRGFRIELGEIEHALADLDCVGRAVVIKWEPADDTPMLVAYVVPSAGSEFQPHELSRLLRERLPSYMVPGRYVEMSSFPLTPNRKIDRGALPSPAEAPEISAGGRRSAPRTDTEGALLRIWSEVLGRQNIALDDDFFDLGGQSLLAVRICDRIHQTISVDLSVSILVDRRTIEELASFIDGLRSGAASPKWTSVVALQTSGSRQPIFCVSGIGGNPMTFLELAEALGPDQPFYGLQHRGVDGKRTPCKSVASAAAEFVADIRSVQASGPYIVAGYSAGGLAAFEMAQQLVRAGEEVRLLVLLDTVNPAVGGWTRRQRLRAHLANLNAHGFSYVAKRVTDKTASVVGEANLRSRARLARWFPYRYRLDAVEMAGRRAQAAYVPGPYQGDVLLLQSDSDIQPGSGIPLKQHEANGWRDLVGGHLEVVKVDADHLGITEGAAGRFVASQISRALSPKAHVDDRRG